MIIPDHNAMELLENENEILEERNQELKTALLEAVVELESFELMVMEDEAYADKAIKLRAIAEK